MVILHNFWTEAMDKMFASESGLYHTVLNTSESPIKEETCIPPLVYTVSEEALGLMLVNRFLLLDTDTVDWLSKRSQDLGIRSRGMSSCRKEMALCAGSGESLRAICRF